MRPQVRSTRTARSTPAPVSFKEDGEIIQNVPVKKGATAEKTTLVPSEPTNTQETLAKRSRHRMTSEQLVFLEDVFKQDTHPSKQKKKDVAGELKMNFKTVTIWFQNRRQITKKNRAVSASESATPTSESPVASMANEEDAEDRSALRRVSSPNQNDTLTTKTPAVPSVPLKDSKRAPLSLVPHGENTTQASKGFCIKIKPLTQPLQSRSQNVEPPRTQELWEHLSSSPTISEWSFHAGEDLDVVEGFGRTPSNEPQVLIGKRPRTLEWACEREAKRRRLGMGEDQLYSASTHSQDSKRNTQEGTTTPKGSQQMDPHAESALLLLSLATGAHTDLSGGLKHTAAPQDVMHGASLLLCFKHSVRH